MRRPTIRDVAKKAGVGVGTVSRVLNNSAQVSDETRQRVLAVIQELHYRPSVVARQLPRRTRLHNIGVITQPFVNYHSFAERLRGVQVALSTLESEYEMVLFNVSSQAHYDEQLAALVRTGTIEGLLIIDLDLNDEQVETLVQANIPFVGINHFKDKTWPCIGTDNIVGGSIATEYLFGTGHRRIAYVGDDFDAEFVFRTSRDRFAGYERVLNANGIALVPEYIRLGNHDYDTARWQTLDLLRLPTPPTAIFAMSDMQALGCIAAAVEIGLRVPEDVSIMGFDDLEISYHTGLTTVRQHLELSGQIGIKYLLHLLHEKEPDPVPELPPLEVISRRTTWPI